jgi:hypothetical protein
MMETQAMTMPMAVAAFMVVSPVHRPGIIVLN